MSPPVIQLPLDLSGTAATNKVVAEPHDIAATGNRAFVTTRGPYFTGSMVVRNAVTGQVLVPGTHYIAVHMDIKATQRSGLEVCSVVLIKAGVNVTKISMDYQAIGGEYSATIDAIEQMLESLDLDNRTINWGDIIGAPDYFPPTAHLHDIGDLYGFEYLVVVLEQIRRAILMGDQAAFDELRDYVDRQDAITRGMIAGFENLINEHTSRTDNPHNVTKTQIGLSNVQNYAIAASADATTGTSNVLYMTPLRVKEAITAQVGNTMNAHIARLDNPHSVTKAQVGLGSVVNYGVATNAQAIAGSGDAYMTATLTGSAITALAVNPLNAHIARSDNPHNTTKTQVGLSAVDNFATASTAQAQAGTATNLFVTPAGARALVQALAVDPMTTHVNRTDNPHGVTKTQIGLSNVDNFKQVRAGSNVITLTWANNEITATVDSSSMGRVHTTSQPDPNIAAHATRSDNPHNTTKAHVGLNNVLNYTVSTQAEAEAGSSNALYMTPLRVKQAITSQAVTPLTTSINTKVTTGSAGQLASLTLGTSGYLYTEADGSVVLRVNSNRFFRFSANGELWALNGRVRGSDGFQPSDRRLKKNIKKVAVRPLWRDFDWKSWLLKEDDTAQRGPIAQQLAKAAPDLVREFNTGKTGRAKRLEVNLVGAALEMAYAAGQRADALEKRLEALEKQMAKLAK